MNSEPRLILAIPAPGPVLAAVGVTSPVVTVSLVRLTIDVSRDVGELVQVLVEAPDDEEETHE